MLGDPQVIPFDYVSVWPRLRHDEKKLLIAMGAIYPTDEAVKFIGRDKHWFYRIRKKSHIRAAIDARESRDSNDTEDIIRLTVHDWEYMALASVGKKPEVKEVSKKKMMSVLKTMESIK